MSSKAGSSKRAAEDITKQSKKIKGIDVRLHRNHQIRFSMARLGSALN